MLYRVKKIFQYTEIVEVEAESDNQALELSNDIDGDVMHDDTLIDAKIIK